jgi:hypothetical protein
MDAIPLVEASCGPHIRPPTSLQPTYLPPQLQQDLRWTLLSLIERSVVRVVPVRVRALVDESLISAAASFSDSLTTKRSISNCALACVDDVVSCQPLQSGRYPQGEFLCVCGPYVLRCLAVGAFKFSIYQA